MRIANGITADNPELAQLLRRGEAEEPFNKPWELRAFAIAVAAFEAGQFEWSEFQGSLIEAIKNWDAENPIYSRKDWRYYEHWLTALEVVLASRGLLNQDGLDEKTKIVLNTPRHHHKPNYEPIAIDPARI
jgi:nitrile hydratase accessory protein